MYAEAVNNTGDINKNKGAHIPLFAEEAGKKAQNVHGEHEIIYGSVFENIISKVSCGDEHGGDKVPYSVFKAVFVQGKDKCQYGPAQGIAVEPEISVNRLGIFEKLKEESGIEAFRVGKNLWQGGDAILQGGAGENKGKKYRC